MRAEKNHVLTELVASGNTNFVALESGMNVRQATAAETTRVPQKISLPTPVCRPCGAGTGWAAELSAGMRRNSLLNGRSITSPPTREIRLNTSFRNQV